jgi:hypothetical protein
MINVNLHYLCHGRYDHFVMTSTKAFSQGSSKTQTYIVIGEVPCKLLVLHVLDPSSIIPPWNTEIHNYVHFWFCKQIFGKHK